MAMQDIIGELEQASEPSRRLDVEIALAVGYRRREPELFMVDGKPVKRSLWLRPGGTDVDRVPNFTESIHQANLLAEGLSQNIGISWEPGTASAKIADGPYCQASTPAIALCIAILKLKLLRDNSAG